MCHLIYSPYIQLEALIPYQGMVVSVSLQIPITELYTTKLYEKTGPRWCVVELCLGNEISFSEWVGICYFFQFFLFFFSSLTISAWAQII